MSSAIRKFDSLTDQAVKEYLLKNFAGKQIYVPRIEKKPMNSRKNALPILRKHGFTDREICRVFGCFPSLLKALDKVNGAKKRGRPFGSRNKNKRVYTKRNVNFWNNHPRKVAPTA